MCIRKILVIDDEEDIRRVFQQAFSNIGYSIVVAGSSEEALGILRNGEFHIIFIDLNLPGMNGIELCRKIKCCNSNTICYALTGYPTIFEQEDCAFAGFDAFFPKPVRFQSLINAVNNALSKLACLEKA